MSISILVVDDCASIRNALSRLFKKSGFTVVLAESGEVALSMALRMKPQVVLLDLCLPDGFGLDLLDRFKQIHRQTVVITMTAYGTPLDAVKAIKNGAFDYLVKPLQPDSLRRLVRTAAGNGMHPRNGRKPPGAPGKVQAGSFDCLISENPAVQTLLEIARGLPAHESPNVLLDGETGTGKELLAQIIHHAHNDHNGPFVPINAGAIPADLIESELFGYVEGAFTGARKGGKKGAFEHAGRGTIFLDEIGEMDLRLQVRLLRVLDQREFSRVGDPTRIPFRARLIVATNLNLKQEVEAGRFRADLYYRLNVVRLTLPPLRDREGDVMLLAESFMREFNRSYGKSFEGFSPQARKLLEGYSWPGNVRELRNVIMRIAVLESGKTIQASLLPSELIETDLLAVPRLGRWCTAPCDRSERTSRDVQRLDRIEQETISRALDRSYGNVACAARMLGLRRGALRYRMQKHGITRELRSELKG